MPKSHSYNVNRKTNLYGISYLFQGAIGCGLSFVLCIVCSLVERVLNKFYKFNKYPYTVPSNATIFNGFFNSRFLKNTVFEPMANGAYDETDLVDGEGSLGGSTWGGGKKQFHSVSAGSFKNYDPERMIEAISRSSSMKMPRFRETTG